LTLGTAGFSITSVIGSGGGDEVGVGCRNANTDMSIKRKRAPKRSKTEIFIRYFK
jgi:hypothetical protein